jgi:hypothetical protein
VLNGQRMAVQCFTFRLDQVVKGYFELRCRVTFRPIGGRIVCLSIGPVLLHELTFPT